MVYLVWELYDGINHREECAEVLATAYMHNNPFIKPLKLTKKDMLQDFLKQLDSQTFRWVFIFFEGELYNQGVKELVGVSCAGDIMDFQNPQGLNQDNNYDQVPNPALVRTYMRYKTLQPFWEKIKNVQPNEYFYVGNSGIKPKYMGRGVVFSTMVLEMLYFLRNIGYQYGVSNAINFIAKKFIAKISDVLNETINLEGMQVVSDNSHPFKDSGLSQSLFAGEIENGIKNLQDYDIINITNNLNLFELSEVINISLPQYLIQNRQQRKNHISLNVDYQLIQF
ncbi:hypothetical protein pb186bvf_010530 [Paramecium bursaria]